MGNLERILEKIQKIVAQIEEFLNALASIWNKAKIALGALFVTLQKLVETAIEALGSAANTVLEALKKYLNQGFEIAQIFRARDVWRDDVAQPFSQIAANLTGLETRKGAWTGEAYGSYSSLTASQDDAASKISTAASSIATSLTVTSGGLIVFYAGVAVAAVILVAELISAGAVTATGVGAPAGVTIAGISIVKWATAIGALLTATVTLAVTQITQIESIKSTILFGGSSPFANNQWPDGNRR